MCLFSVLTNLLHVVSGYDVFTVDHFDVAVELKIARPNLVVDTGTERGE